MKLEIGGKIYELEFTINAVCDFEELTKQPLIQSLSVGGYRSLRVWLMCGLIGHHKVTLKKAGELVQQNLNENHSIDDLSAIIGDAVEQAGFLKAQALPQLPQKQENPCAKFTRKLFKRRTNQA